MSFKIESEHQLTSDFLPSGAFTREYSDLSGAIAIAIEGVDNPESQEVRVINTESGDVVWVSTEEKYE